MVNKIYICGWMDNQVGIFNEVFVSDDLDKISKWCIKFNRILQKYKFFLKQFEITWENGMKDVKEEHFDKWYIRWSDINSIAGSAYKEIEFR